MNYSEIISKLIDLGLSPLPVVPYQATPVGKKTGKPIFTGKNPSYLTGGAINAEIVNHSDFQNTIPNSQFLEVWFRYPETGIGCLGSHRYRWLDLDRKHFANQGDCDLALLQICPHAQDGWLEQTQSGGYRLLVDCGETGADFTNFSLTEGGDHVGELLGAGRFAVIAPTKGVNGQYTNLNYGDPIPLSELNIFTTAKKREAVAIKPSVPSIPTSKDIIELFSCVTPAVKAILTGTPESDDRSADITKAARELYGWQNWLNANSINYSGSADDLINDCGDVFGVDSDRVERIKKTIDPSSCLPACVIKGGDEAALLKVKMSSSSNPPSPKTTSQPTPKKYHVEYVHLCSRRVQRILMGESERVTVSVVVEAWQELKAWERALQSFPDTTTTTSINRIIETICEQNDIDLDEVTAAITKAKPLTDNFINKSAINETVRTWRYKFMDDGEEDEKKKFDAEQQKSLEGRIERLLNTNLKFNTQIGEWFEYVDGVFDLREKDQIHGTIRHHLKLLRVKDWKLKSTQVKEATVKEYLENMKSNSLVTEMDDLRVTRGLINLQDGTYDRINKVLLEHSQSHGFTVQLPYKWTDATKASAAPIVRWLWESLDGQIDQVFFAMCYLNAIVCRRSDLQVLLQIIGKAGAGKSTFTRLSEALVGSANVLSSQLQILEEDKFELSNLIGKPLVLINEIDTNYKGSGAILKGLTGGDRMANRIKHKQSRGNSDFTYDGKIIITANEEFRPSRVFDDWARRNRVLRFQKTVDKSKVKNLIENRKDGSITGEFAPHIPAFLQLILSIDDDLVKRVLLEPEVYAPSMNEIRDESILKESSIAQWLEECVVFNPQARTYIGAAKRMNSSETINGVSKSQVIFEGADEKLHANYAQWCTDRGMPFTGFQRFSPDLLRIVNDTLKIDYVKRLNKDNIGTAIAGVELRTKYHDDIPTPIKKLLTNSHTTRNETLTPPLIEDSEDKTFLYKIFLQEFIEDLSPIGIDNNNNNLEDNKGEILNKWRSKDSSPLDIGVGSEVAVEIEDQDVANIVVSATGVTLKTASYKIINTGQRYGEPIAYLEGVNEPIETRYLRVKPC